MAYDESLPYRTVNPAGVHKEIDCRCFECREALALSSRPPRTKLLDKFYRMLLLINEQKRGSPKDENR
ncbi:hypothetical protein A2872_03000 [Candidatus Gottesmanbacteria bacterium RIFCSPHIGHO2_01_FULL_42_12]|uniref:Uncharacterized protein n=1 Tax=Candidatus Gottesmanbacteria bacterium RIFCSPHIGHO2_01_FULL_42_12 TaxID=1798377 RepID=A0A1F5Z4P1_9BACT|nr:MAG: hypothetical protein A2872_03000 [Candidatus Gottesmanbacteria bacterium RIFCSPHIGHO2_01_FULL_42_12]